MTMRALDRLRMIARSWLRSRRADDDLSEELRFHLERETEANVGAGMAPADARRAALLSLGSIEGIKEVSRDRRPGAWARRAGRDAAYGARLLRKAPGFAAAGILIVALGVGSVTAIFSVVYGVVLRPLTYAEPDRLVAVWTRAPRLRLPRALVAAADAREWQRGSRVFEDTALVRPIANFNLVGEGEPERLLGARVSANLFDVLGVKPALGRTFIAGEDGVGHDDVVLLSHGLWKRRFGGDASIVGRTISLSGTPHTVVGVMSPDFQYPGREFQVWTPLMIDPDELTRKETPYNYRAIARLRRGVDVRQAQAEMDQVAARLEQAFPVSNRETGFEVVALRDETVRAVRSALYVLLGAVSCLLLIACLNLANLLGARAAARSREFAVRLALGASRGRLALQALAEVAPVLAIGGVLGVAGAAWAMAAFVPLAPSTVPRLDGIGLNVPVLAFALAMLAITGVIAGLVPAAQAWQSDLAGATRENSRSATGGRRQSAARDALVVGQIALAVPLLVGAVLLARSFSALTRLDPGFRAEGVVSAHLAIPRTKYRDDRQVAAFCARVLDGVATRPGVVSAGMVNRLPLGGVGQLGSIEFENVDAEGSRRPSADWRTVTPGYFATMGITLREGRTFTEHDGEGSPLVGIVDERIARTLWPGQSALGHRFRIPGADVPWTEIVGVVGHVRQDTLDVDLRPQVYWNYRQRAQDRMVLVVRGGGDARSLMPVVAEAVRFADPEQPLYDVRAMDEVVDRSLAQRWLSTALLAAFAAVSLLLASVGVYGVVAFGVTRRVREFGIRMALGAGRADVSRLVLRQGARLAAVGVAAGLAAAALVSGAMESLVYGVGARDAASFAASAGVLLAVAVLASYLPARRAASVDPAVTLRSD
ncbi:MAG: ABC transporter permease [Acidobacteria bacterium]|nr:MAG: ABC transporter permease [Acidobacteriota bacterium]